MTTKKNTKMGRTRRTKQLSTARIAFRVSAEELALIKRAASFTHTEGALSPGEFARSVTLIYARAELERRRSTP